MKSEELCNVKNEELKWTEEEYIKEMTAERCETINVHETLVEGVH